MFKDNTVAYLHIHKPTHAHTHSHTHIHINTRTQWVPKRDPSKQEMTAEGRSGSRERTNATRPLSKTRREGEGT